MFSASRTPERAALAVGIASHAFVVVVVVVFARMIIILNQLGPGEAFPNEGLWTILMAVELVGIVWMLLVYIGHVLENERLGKQAQAGWVIAFLAIFPIAVPAYWWAHWRIR